MYKLKNASIDWCNENFLNSRALKSCNDVRTQLRKYLEKHNKSLPQDNYTTDLSKKKAEEIKKAIITGFFSQVAHMEPQGFYYTVKEHQIVLIHPSSGLLNLKPIWILYNDFVLTNKNYIRTCLKVNPRDLLEINRMNHLINSCIL
jgi:pre-mRNA-splicing factor ATP-dependent RNA helicase DHX15/PRP43